ncbi:MAG TPA: hypothetical protein VHW93_10350 [Acidimicrobiales bacterium]|nr:hypothetical protein [Acidimicrobiales bacterium]
MPTLPAEIVLELCSGRNKIDTDPAVYMSPFVAFHVHQVARLGQLNETSPHVPEPDGSPTDT